MSNIALSSNDVQLSLSARFTSFSGLANQEEGKEYG